MRSLILGFALLFSQVSFAQYIGDISFSQEQIRVHNEQIKKFIDVTRASMIAETQKHNAQYKKFGFGIYYGFKSAFAKLDDAGKKRYVQKLLAKRFGNDPKKWPTDYTFPMITSCIKFAMKHLKAGFETTGQGNLYTEIDKYTAKHDYTGLALQRSLVELGWHGVYWNQDVTVAHGSQNGDEKKNGFRPSWQIYAYQIAKKKGEYYNVPVQSFLINYLPAKKSKTIQDLSGIQKLQKIPLYVGVAHGAYHTFLGYNGRISESHSPYNPENVDNIEDNLFYPTWEKDVYYSGAFVVPPGTW